MSWKRPIPLAALILVPVLAACGAGDEDAGPGADNPAQSVAGAETQLNLAPVDHSGVTGTVAVDRDDENVTLTVSLEGLDPGSRYPAHVHDGRCVSGGAVRIPLERITASDGGTGRSTTRIPLAELPPDEPTFVQVHGEEGRAVACVDLPFEAGEEAPTTPPVMPGDSAGG